MERLTEYTRFQGSMLPVLNNGDRHAAIERLALIEDILGDDYDLSRLRELVQADREGRCVVLPIPVPSMAYTVNPKEKYISIGFYMTPGSVLHDTERGYIIAKAREVAEAALKEREKNEP